MVLTIEQFKASQKLAPFIIAFVVGFAALIFISASNMLLFSLVMVLCLLLGQYRLQTCILKAK
jgi:predicted branched-subunit amino acid permease